MSQIHLSPAILLPMFTSTTICDFARDSRTPTNLIPSVLYPWFPNPRQGPVVPPQPPKRQHTNQSSTDDRPRM